MHYEFPKITRFSDVEPYLDDNFRVKEQSGVLFINYNLSNQITFPPVSSVGDAIRREFRGIAFNASSGYILSRPFHKFFNLSERPDEEPDWSIGHTNVVKLDGSMLRPVRYPSGAIRWCTKAGITDVALQAEVFVAKNPVYEKFAERMLERFLTPIFEYVGPENRIVLDYQEEDMVLLAIRNMVTGEYLRLDQSVVKYLTVGIPIVTESHLATHEVKGAEDAEGVVIRFDDGHMLKVKSEWYVLRHKGKELISNERKVVGMILDGTLDDVLPFVSKEQREALAKFNEDFEANVHASSAILEQAYAAVRKKFETKKDFATVDVWPWIGFKPWLRSAIFALWDEKETPSTAILSAISKNLSTEDKYQAVKTNFQIPNLEQV